MTTTGSYNPLSLSSSEEEDLPRQARTKPSRKNEKYKARLVGSLLASLGIFLVVMIAIVSLATSHSANTSITSPSTGQLTTHVNNKDISGENYEDLANPHNIIVVEEEEIKSATVNSDETNSTLLNDDVSWDENEELKIKVNNSVNDSYDSDD